MEKYIRLSLRPRIPSKRPRDAAPRPARLVALEVGHDRVLYGPAVYSHHVIHGRGEEVGVSQVEAGALRDDAPPGHEGDGLRLDPVVRMVQRAGRQDDVAPLPPPAGPGRMCNTTQAAPMPHTRAP